MAWSELCLLCALLCAHCVMLAVARATGGVRFPNFEGNTCRGVGHTGCCQGWLNCTSADKSCYCDKLCYQFDDCCADIQEICAASEARQVKSKLQQFSFFNGSTCRGVGFTGCCEGLACTSADSTCYCDRLCHVFGDCCGDISSTCPESTPTPPPPTNCSSAGHTSGCCVGSTSDCRVQTPSNGLCYCDLRCYTENNCCEDVQQIGCLPQNCTEAGKLGCVASPGELCSVTTPSGVCYCDANCTIGSSDCCNDALQAFRPGIQHQGRDGQLRDFAKLMLYVEMLESVQQSRKQQAPKIRGQKVLSHS